MTDGQTHDDGIYYASMASHGKKQSNISQGNAATRLKSGGIFNVDFYYKFTSASTCPCSPVDKSL